LSFTDESGIEYRLKAVDLTFQTYVDHLRVCHKLSVEEVEIYVNNQIFSHHDIYMRVGLARGWANYPDRCFLQITGIFTFPEYLENHCFQEFQKEIEIVGMQREVHEKQRFYGDEPNDEYIPF
jgi:hypothetical protein